MLIVHHLEKSRSQRILWLLEELGLPYELKLYKRDPATLLAPPALKAIHPLGKSPVVTDGDVTLAESGAILEYLADQFEQGVQGDLEHLIPVRGSIEQRQCRFWMHYAEGSLMNWLVMKAVFVVLPSRPMPFFVRPVARQLCRQVLTVLVDPNLTTAMEFMESHLEKHLWFAGDRLTLCDFQMSYAVESVLSRGTQSDLYPRLLAYRERINARPAYQRAIQRGGPVVLL